jgi:signal transduction histidine kinase
MEKGDKRKMDTTVNILIVDDNIAKLEYLSAIIENDFLNIVKVEDGYAAADKAGEIEFALILLDILMPGLDGYETAGLIRTSAKNFTTPIIFVTDTYKADEHRFKGYASGAVDYLTTPLVPQIVKSKVDIFVELFRKTKKLEQVITNNEKFYSIMAHDLRSPFHPLLGFSQILMEDADTMKPEEVKEISAEINQVANKLFQLLTDLLELTRLRSEDYIYTPANINLRNVVEYVFGLLNSNALSKKIILTDKTEDSNLFADRIMLQTIIQNLVSNAIKFTPEEGTISVGSKVVGENIEITVADNGVGIKPENLEKLFAGEIKFTTTGTNKEVGTGLGLSICNELVKRQNGTIKVESQVGNLPAGLSADRHGKAGGTTFIITLPKFVSI